MPAALVLLCLCVLYLVCFTLLLAAPSESAPLVANDNTYTLSASVGQTLSQQLKVLADDTGIGLKLVPFASEDAVLPLPQGSTLTGAVSITADSLALKYIVTFDGKAYTDNFRYRVQDANGQKTTALVTVNVGECRGVWYSRMCTGRGRESEKVGVSVSLREAETDRESTHGECEAADVGCGIDQEHGGAVAAYLILQTCRANCTCCGEHQHRLLCLTASCAGAARCEKNHPIFDALCRVLTCRCSRLAERLLSMIALCHSGMLGLVACMSTMPDTSCPALPGFNCLPSYCLHCCRCCSCQVAPDPAGV